MAFNQGSRNVDLGKSETELATNIKKATSIDETAPKRKHVRACIVYTWVREHWGCGEDELDKECLYVKDKRLTRVW